METYEKLLHLRKEVMTVKLEEANINLQAYNALMNQRYEEAAEIRDKKHEILKKYKELRQKLSGLSGHLNNEKFPMTELDLWLELWEDLGNSEMKLEKKFKGFIKLNQL